MTGLTKVGHRQYVKCILNARRHSGRAQDAYQDHYYFEMLYAIHCGCSQTVRPEKAWLSLSYSIISSAHHLFGDTAAALDVDAMLRIGHPAAHEVEIFHLTGF